MKTRDPKILVVEENKYHSLMLEREFESRLRDSTVMITHSGRLALEAVRMNDFDIAIIDFSMSDYDGLEFLRLLRNEAPEIAIIVVAADLTEKMAKEAFKIGCEEILIKDSSFHVVIPRLVQQVYRQIVSRSTDRLGTSKHADKREAELIRIMATTMSHEINNPLMTILGTVELMLDSNYQYDPEMVKKLTMIQKSGQRIQSTLERMTSISRPAIRDTRWGKMIDPETSEVATKSGV